MYVLNMVLNLEDIMGCSGRRTQAFPQPVGIITMREEMRYTLPVLGLMKVLEG